MSYKASSATYAARATSPSMYTLWLVVQSLGALGVLVGSYCCYSYGAANPVSSLGTFSSSSIGDLVLSPMAGCEHPLLYLSCTGRASQETAISGSCQQALVGIHNIMCLLVIIQSFIFKKNKMHKNTLICLSSFSNQ
jgi:hypothetical protein